MGVRELVGDAKKVPASEKVKNHCSRKTAFFKATIKNNERDS